MNQASAVCLLSIINLVECLGFPKWWDASGSILIFHYHSITELNHQLRPCFFPPFQLMHEDRASVFFTSLVLYAPYIQDVVRYVSTESPQRRNRQTALVTIHFPVCLSSSHSLGVLSLQLVSH